MEKKVILKVKNCIKNMEKGNIVKVSKEIIDNPRDPLQKPRLEWDTAIVIATHTGSYCSVVYLKNGVLEVIENHKLVFIDKGGDYLTFRVVDTLNKF